MIIVPIYLEITLEGGHALPLDHCELAYDPKDPYAVTLTVRDDTHGSEVVWTMGRSLLAEGLARQSPPELCGDVTIWRCGPDDLHIVLDSPDGRAELHGEAEQADAFLMRTYLAVPFTHEMDGIDLDAELALIFGETA
ncbi:SsgA family sporulation/cell division regulator [Streptomyces sp. NBC_00687]|uniref:SsgA family sporulation/cell division regulator n=1 Tax=Streptomyces sp. NBC_00687 TaxID=2975807 RepID=UPI0022564720|nr:SsgA family sporulation/cell division regulator [Streptomyces sp. NBC_00687]MCX4912843.1 SsgA family sporulation/cell division regulator [Streptomyces sp. NBC_00687]